MAPDLKKQFSTYLWVEKYRPTTVGEEGLDVLLPKQYKDFFQKIVETKDIPNLLLYSSTPGSGKTSIAKAICYDLDADYRYINISSQSGIDTLRNDIQKYASMKSLSGKPKIIIMDEADGASITLQQGLRAAIEEFKNSCRFIFTCNYQTKIIPAIKSRCTIFDFNMTEKKIVDEMKPKIHQRLRDILTVEEIEFSEPTIERLVDTYYPDIRKMIQLCQQHSTVNKCITDDIFSLEMIEDEFYEYILGKKLGKARKFLIDKNYNYSELYTELSDNLLPKIDDPNKRCQILLIIGEYMYRHSFVIDQEINAACCIAEIIANI